MKQMSRLLAAVVMFGIAGACAAAGVPGPLVETDWLADNADKVVILDVRKDVKSFAAQPVFVEDKKTKKKKLAKVAGHIPGAILVNYKEVRATREIGGKKVEGVVPEKGAFEALMQKSGVNGDSAVVIVSKGRSNLDMTMATRLYWQLKYYGHDNVAVLNGGMAQWITDGRAVSADAGKAGKGNWTATAQRDELLAGSDEVAKASESGAAQLVDNRPISQYLGTSKRSYVYDYGHIPGAKMFPNELMTEVGAPAKFLGTDKLRALADQLGVKTDGKAITYCNSGHLASGGWFIMHELLGNKDVKLYDGSMHEWTLEKRPVTSMKIE
jgi:thiosulfate/3-mercaptopyruvate sulfurtransferase